MKIIDADALSESLRRKLATYEGQVVRVRRANSQGVGRGQLGAGAEASLDINDLNFRIRGIRCMLAELRDAEELPEPNSVVVRCKQCIYSEILGGGGGIRMCSRAPNSRFSVDDDDFCSQGERK